MDITSKKQFLIKSMGVVLLEIIIGYYSIITTEFEQTQNETKKIKKILIPALNSQQLPPQDITKFKDLLNEKYKDQIF